MERFYLDALIPYFEDSEGFLAAWGIENDVVALGRPHEGSPERGYPADMVAVEVDLVCADDAYFSFLSSGVGVQHRRTKVGLRLL